MRKKCVKNPCSICKFRVHNNHKAIFCNICHLRTHLKCTPLSLSEYNDLTHSHDDWYCPSCLSDTFPFNHFDSDTDFYFALLDLQSSANFDGSLLGTKYFNPFLEDPDTYQLLHNSDLDPDINMLSSTSNLLSRCTYMNSRQFNNLFSDSSNSNCFSLFHLNIHSFKKHSVDLEEYLSTLNTSFSAIGLSETSWLDTTSNDLYSIPGYHFISKPRPVGSGGGVGIFLCDTYEYKKRCDLESMNCVLESVFVEIVQNVISGCLYKPPNVQTEIFNDEIKQVLAKIGFENKLCFLFGDFNINILNADSHVPTNDFIHLMYSNGFYPLISKPTRITSHSATLINNIFSNDLDNHKFSGILWSDISDHLPIFPQGAHTICL